MRKGERWLREVALAYVGEDCLPWPFYVEKNGYARVGVAGERIGAHAFVCQEVHGPSPSEEHEAAHKCGFRACCNKGHVRWLTTAENNLEKLDHGTMARGETHGMTDATADEVRAIRAATGYLKDIAAKFGRSIAGVHHIRSRRCWGWLE